MGMSIKKKSCKWDLTVERIIGNLGLVPGRIDLQIATHALG